MHDAALRVSETKSEDPGGGVVNCSREIDLDRPSKLELWNKKIGQRSRGNL